jgi:formate dehydrogenase subunit gamma
MVRISAAIAAVILAGLFAITISNGLQPARYIVPTGGVTASGKQDAVPAGPQATKTLTARTELQRWRAVGGPAPGVDTLDVAKGTPLAASNGSSPQQRDTVGNPTAGAGAAETGPERTVQGWVAQRAADWGILRPEGHYAGTVNIPKERARVLIQPEGRGWQGFHNDFVTDFGGWIIFGIGLLLALFLLVRGRIPLELGFSGRMVIRFSAIERANHWMTASSFIAMALTGLIVLYGRYFLRPLFGAGAYESIAGASLYIHVACAIPFIVGLVTMIVLWLPDQLPAKVDLRWLTRFGGFLNDSPVKPPAWRFNAGQKLIFWTVIVGGILLFLSGLSLVFPFYWLDVQGMQVALGLHSVLALLMIGAIIGHIYIGTVGMVGAFDAMWEGEVDRNWAEEHHRLWLARIEGRPPEELKEETVRIYDEGHARSPAE